MTTLSLSHAPLDSLKASFVELGWVSSGVMLHTDFVVMKLGSNKEMYLLSTTPCGHMRGRTSCNLRIYVFLSHTYSFTLTHIHCPFTYMLFHYRTQLSNAIAFEWTVNDIISHQNHGVRSCPALLSCCYQTWTKWPFMHITLSKQTWVFTVKIQFNETWLGKRSTNKSINSCLTKRLCKNSKTCIKTWKISSCDHFHWIRRLIDPNATVQLYVNWLTRLVLSLFPLPKTSNYFPLVILFIHSGFTHQHTSLVVTC